MSRSDGTGVTLPSGWFLFQGTWTLRAAPLDTICVTLSSFPPRRARSNRRRISVRWSLATPTVKIPVVTRERCGMPRAADPRNEPGRRKTEVWRGKLRAARMPEACHVDTALAAAVAVVIADQRDQGEVSADLQLVLSTARAILKQRGYDGKGPSAKLMSRVFYRRDLPALARTKRRQPEQVTRPKRNELTSPHYSVDGNHVSRQSGSDGEEL